MPLELFRVFQAPCRAVYGTFGFSGQCTGVSEPFRLVPSSTGFPSKRCPGIGFLSRAHRSLFSVESDDTDTENERRDMAGASGGVAAPLPQKVPPTTAVEATVGASGSSSTQSTRGGHTETGRDVTSVEPPSVSPARHQLTSALSRMTQGLRWVRFTLGRSSSANQ